MLFYLHVAIYVVLQLLLSTHSRATLVRHILECSFGPHEHRKYWHYSSAFHARSMQRITQ